MSYDLAFRTPPGGTKPSAEQIAAFFSGRPHYEVEPTGAYYGNEDTGVYFGFTFGGEFDETELEAPPSEVEFELNYNRPSFFAREAMPELRELADTFGFIVDDPQHDGMGEGGAFSEEGFLRGWDTGNLFGIQVATNDPGGEPLSLPTSKLTSIWQWNFNRNRRQEAEGEVVFVPKIMPILDRGVFRTAIAWTDLIPTVIPEVDAVFLLLQRYKGVFERGKAERLMPFGDVLPFLDDYVPKPEPIRHWRADHAKPPKSLVSAARKARKIKDDLQILNWEAVIDEEFIVKARRRQ